MLERIKPLISADELKKQLPVSDKAARVRDDGVRQIKAVLDGTDSRKIFIVGPCSADDPDAVCEYAQKLKAVADKIQDKILTVMRVYTAKPRSRGDGYMGLLHSPNAKSGNIDFQAGIVAMRKLHIDVTEIGLPTADEMVYSQMAPYTDDLLSYVTIGARTAEDPMHRFTASGLDVPIGIKNSLGGNMTELAGSIHAASKSNEFIFDRSIVRTSGNAYVHGVLRGAVDLDGNNIPNCGYDKVMRAAKDFKSQGVNCGVIVDTGHANSGKNPSMVRGILADIVGHFADGEYNAFVKGIMIESYLLGGSKAVTDSGRGISVTDPCLSFAETEDLLLYAAAAL
ncbi:MAG: 3-deoxy-7-phosphoheptulonate synthase [Clostridiales bacterium]|nr:3-deoxy-7-phosphoheptulonate synthase [Clostridiales bacterium]